MLKTDRCHRSLLALSLKLIKNRCAKLIHKPIILRRELDEAFLKNAACLPSEQILSSKARISRNIFCQFMVKANDKSKPTSIQKSMIPRHELGFENRATQTEQFAAQHASFVFGDRQLACKISDLKRFGCKKLILSEDVAQH